MTNSDWTTPGVYEVVPGVYRIPLPLPNDGLRAVNVYAITGDHGPVLIDSGWGIQQSRDLLRDGLAELGAEVSDIAHFLITHVHNDHYSQAIHVRRETGVRVTLGAQERYSLELARRLSGSPIAEMTNPLIALGANELLEEFRAKVGRPDASDLELPDDWSNNGDLFQANGRTLETVETPGHTRGHVVFYDNDAALLFAGDHVLPTITPSIGFEPARVHNPLGDFLNSLAIVRARPDAMLLPAHGHVTASVHTRVDELVEHHRVRLDTMAAVMGEGADTAWEVAGKVTWTRHERVLSDLDIFNKYLATCETGAHLELMVSQDRATVKEVDGVRHYCLVAS
ncbi:MAG TPA: MBL fold metallo-hydrolase [Mycobacteriales bacterium]|nr:MBL fold metallo-hydrolase [Mycobacteriales bacterium]